MPVFISALRALSITGIISAGLRSSRSLMSGSSPHGICSWARIKAQDWNARIDDNAENVEVIVETMSSRLHQCCRIETFSQSRLADWILNHITRLQELIAENNGLSLWAVNRQLSVLLDGMGLVMIDLRNSVAPAGTLDACSVLTLPNCLSSVLMHAVSLMRRDIAVVGAGITGIMTALACARKAQG